jgi:hypothetical protein
MSYGAGFKFRNLFDPATHVIREIFNKIGVNLKINPDFEAHFVDHVQKIWECSSNKDILLINYPGFHFIIDKDDLISQLDVQAGTVHDTTNESHIRKPIPEGMTIEELVETMEDNEDTVECTNCGGLFEKTSCSHNKEGFGWHCNNCNKLDDDQQLVEGYSWIGEGDQFVLETSRGYENYIVLAVPNKLDQKYTERKDRYITIAKMNDDGDYEDPFDIEYTTLAKYKNTGKLEFI